MNYAGFWKRWLALVIDSVILMIPGLILSKVTYGVGGVVLSLFYKPIFEASAISATPGKALLGMVVVSEAGNRLTLKQAYLRLLFSWASGLLLGIGYLIAAFTSKKQTLHDLAVSSVVVYREAPDVNYLQIWWAEMQRMFGGAAAAHSNPNFPGTAGMSPTATAEIESLFKLYQSGALTEAEYQEKKAQILARF